MLIPVGNEPVVVKTIGSPCVKLCVVFVITAGDATDIVQVSVVPAFASPGLYSVKSI